MVRNCLRGDPQAPLREVKAYSGTPCSPNAAVGGGSGLRQHPEHLSKGQKLVPNKPSDVKQQDVVGQMAPGVCLAQTLFSDPSRHCPLEDGGGP